MGASKQATHRDRQRQATRLRLFEAAVREIAQHGLESASVAEISRLAGTSRTAYYFHFPRKDSVLEMLALQLSSVVAARIDALPAETGLELVFREFTERVREFWGERRRLAADTATVWLGERTQGPVQKALLRRIEQGAMMSSTPKDPLSMQASALVDRFVVAHWLFVLEWGLGTVPSLDDGAEALLLTVLPKRLRFVPAPGRSPSPLTESTSDHGRAGEEVTPASQLHDSSSGCDAS